MATRRKTRYILNCIPSRDTDRDWGYAAAISAGVVRDGRVPASVDLRAGWWAVRDQKDTGACVGFATADGVLRYHFVKAGWLEKDDRPSPRFIWMANKETDPYTEYPTTFIEQEGTFVKLALAVARRYGCVLEKDLPMKGGLSRLGMETFYTRAAKLRIASYHNLGTDPKAWRGWIANQGPVLTRLDVDSTFSNATKKTSVLSTYRPRTARGGHAVCLVGYTPGHFIVRNSWGRSWGDAGFAYATDAYAIEAFTEAYGAVL